MLENYIKEFVEKVYNQYVDIKSKFTDIYNHLTRIYEKLNGIKSYKVIANSYDSPIYGSDCHEDRSAFGYDETIYSFKSNQDIQVGDFIRVYDDTYHMGVTRVIKRVYDWNSHAMFLFCVKDDEKNDFIFSGIYANLCSNHLSAHKDEVNKIMEENKSNPRVALNLIARQMVEKYAERRSCLDWWNKENHTKLILSDMLGIEYHRPERWEFDDM